MLNCLSRKREQDLEQQLELIAEEIHDGACQYVTAAQMAFDAFHREQTPTCHGDWRTFEMGREFLGRAGDELRRLTRGLRPIHLAAGDLQKAVESLVQETRTTANLDIELCCDIQADQIPEPIELAAFRIVQESLNNARRHSKSKRVLIGLSQDDDSLFIQVQDWGRGFDSNHVPQGCCGIAGIRRRVRTLHGDVSIRSDPGDGTLITVELPLKE